MFAKNGMYVCQLANIGFLQPHDNKRINGNRMFAIGKHGAGCLPKRPKCFQKQDVNDGKHTPPINAKTSLVYTHHPRGLGWCVSPYGWVGWQRHLPMVFHPSTPNHRKRRTGMMHAKNVHIWWNTTAKGLVTDLLVTESCEIQAGFQCNDGACWLGWMESPGFGPEAVFGKLVFSGFLTPAHARNALRQFAEIDCCQWARNMLGDL